MNKTIKIAVSIATLLTGLGMLAVSFYALTIPHFGLFLPCFLLALVCGFFLRYDYNYFFGKKDGQEKSGTQASQ